MFVARCAVQDEVNSQAKISFLNIPVLYLHICLNFPDQNNLLSKENCELDLIFTILNK